MSQSIQDLMRKAAELKPQMPGRSSYRRYLRLLIQMREDGYTHTDMAAFLVAQGEVPASNEHNCRRCISSLLARHAKPVPANTTSTPKLP